MDESSGAGMGVVETGLGAVDNPAVELGTFVVFVGFFGSDSVAPLLVVAVVNAAASVAPAEEHLKKDLS